MKRPGTPHAKILRRRIADENHAVVTVDGGSEPERGYRRKPCRDCPWRTDQPVGRFPAEAFRISANTAYDMSEHRFGCHMSGLKKPETCAGFLLRGANHNLAVRLDLIRGTVTRDTVTTDTPLYDSYRAMAEANGVDPDDPALEPCR